MCTKKKLSYRRETARRAVSVETVQNIAQIRDVHEIFSAETETRRCESETRLRPRRYKLPRRCRDVW